MSCSYMAFIRFSIFLVLTLLPRSLFLPSYASDWLFGFVLVIHLITSILIPFHLFTLALMLCCGVYQLNFSFILLSPF